MTGISRWVGIPTLRSGQVLTFIVSILMFSADALVGMLTNSPGDIKVSGH
jgi:hypothetical protein